MIYSNHNFLKYYYEEELKMSNKDITNHDRDLRCIWPLFSPLVENITIISDNPSSSPTPSSPVWALTIQTRVRFDLSCPKYKEERPRPPVEIIITDTRGGQFKDTLDINKLSTSRITMNAGSRHTGLDGIIRVNYDFCCVYFDEGAIFKKLIAETNLEYPLQGVSLINWSSQTSPIIPSMSSSHIKNYPGSIQNTMRISNVHATTPPSSPVWALTIQTQVRFEPSGPNPDKPEIDLTVINAAGQVYQDKLSSGRLSTDAIQLKPGNDFAGLKSKIVVNYGQGCIYFEDDDKKPLLLKPQDETSGVAGDYPLRFIKIFDWMGNPIP
jgi:hypothetical protein